MSADEFDPKKGKEPGEGEGADAPDEDDAAARALIKAAFAKRAAAPAAEEEKQTETEEPTGPTDEELAKEFGELDEVDLRDALRGALRPPEGSVAPSLLGGVQKKLRIRSRGKFYGDGWSTADSPKSTYLITSVIMLILVALVFLVLIPWSSASLR